MNKKIILLVLIVCISACNLYKKESSEDFNLEFEKFELDNGIDIIFHIDRSDPVVSVILMVHVGSAREKVGKTGFAHLFEHLIFQQTENLGKGGFDKLSASVGGSGANAYTNRDITNYQQTVPKDALEKMLWAESDRLGWFINTVTEPGLIKEKQVVKNEIRQSMDNVPYGYGCYVFHKYLYPENHPYNWQVIGSREDVHNATLEDVREFYNRWYVPNNVALIISGDFNIEKTKEWVHKYFNEIPKGKKIEPIPKLLVKLDKTLKLYHEDNFAVLPGIGMIWPTAELYHPDSYPLAVLTHYLSKGKKAPLYKVLVEEEELTSGVDMFNYNNELAGELQLIIRAYADEDLDTVFQAIQKGFAKFEAEGISEKDVNRIKAVQEANLYNELTSTLSNGIQLGQYNLFLGDPGFIHQDIQNIRAVTKADVMRVYERYIRGKNYVATSFVPKGKLSLALEGSVKADIMEEEIVQEAEETFDISVEASFKPSLSSFDRTIEPPFGKTPEVKVPEIWDTELSNGLRVYGIENREVPLVYFSLTIDGGQLMDDINKVGVANFVAGIMPKGTISKTTLELEEAIQQLGASINVEARKESIHFWGYTLSKNFQQTFNLITEILCEPRWDKHEFELFKQKTIDYIRKQKAEPNTIAQNIYNKLIYGKDNILSRNIAGTEESVNSITIDDLKAFYESNLSPSLAKLHIVGAVDQEFVMKSLESINQQWKSKVVIIPLLNVPELPARSIVYFYDVPDAKQSVLRLGNPSMTATNEDYYPATVMNYILGGGVFASQLTQQVREGKGYTYWIQSEFSEMKTTGAFTISSNVQSNITLEAIQLIKEILENYADNYSEKDMKTTKNFLIKSNARAFEVPWEKLKMLEKISNYGWNYSYVKDRETVVNDMTVDKIKELANQYVDPDKMIWLVIGDAKTQLDRLKLLGFGEPVLINEMTGIGK